MRYQRTHRTTISWSKCRPLKSSSIGTNPGIGLSSQNQSRGLHQSPTSDLRFVLGGTHAARLVRAVGIEQRCSKGKTANAADLWSARLINAYKLPRETQAT